MKKPTILLIEDDELDIISVERSLKKIESGYILHTAYNGIEAFKMLRDPAMNLVPDVILLDIMMPNLDGYSTLEEIKKNKALNNTKVLFLSAKNNPKDIEKGIEMGADAYVTKPYSIKKLIQQIEEMFE